MRRDKDFLKAVLAWAVVGSVEWCQSGLAIPASVEAATDGLFDHNDFLREFIDECCFVDQTEKVPVKALRDAYERWCGDQGEEPAQGRTFNRMMEERGYERKQAKVKGMGCKVWMGVRLKNFDEMRLGLPDEGLTSSGAQQADAGDGEREARTIPFPKQKSKHATVFNGDVSVA
jgi:phage/plasmid-associated DNA primase